MLYLISLIILQDGNFGMAVLSLVVQKAIVLHKKLLLDVVMRKLES